MLAQLPLHNYSGSLLRLQPDQQTLVALVLIPQEELASILHVLFATPVIEPATLLSPQETCSPTAACSFLLARAATSA